MFDTDIQQPIVPGNGRLLLLGLTSLILYISVFMTIFTPFPLALATIVYGRRKGYFLSLICWSFGLLLAVAARDYSAVIFYTFSVIFAGMISETVLRKIRPMQGMVKFGLTFIATMGMLFFFATSGSNFSVKDFLVEQITASSTKLEETKELLKQKSSQEAFESLALLEQPELLADQVMKAAPSWFFISVFFILWANLFMILRSRRFIFGRRTYPYSEFHLLRFSMPDYFIWGVVAGLVLLVFGDDLIGAWGPVMGTTVLKCLGVFYFFQGFGIYLDFLSFLRIGGFFRLMLIIITVMAAYEFVAIIGLLDMYLNFRKILTKKKNQGE